MKMLSPLSDYDKEFAHQEFFFQLYLYVHQFNLCHHWFVSRRRKEKRGLYREAWNIIVIGTAVGKDRVNTQAYNILL
jgi:hypothetical protein